MGPEVRSCFRRLLGLGPEVRWAGPFCCFCVGWYVLLTVVLGRFCILLWHGVFDSLVWLLMFLVSFVLLGFYSLYAF